MTMESRFSKARLTRRRKQPPTAFLLIAAIGTLYSSSSHGFPLLSSSSSTSSSRQSSVLAAVQVDPRKTQTQSQSQTHRQRQTLPSRVVREEESTLVEDSSSLVGALWQLNEFQIRCDADQEEEEEEQQAHRSEEDEVDENESDHEARSEKARKMAARAALLGSRTGRASASSKKAASKKKATSVGDRRMGSASKARQGAGMQKRLMDALRKSASSNTVDTEQNKIKPSKEEEDDEDRNDEASSSSSTKATMTTSPKKLTSAGIHETVLELMERQMRYRMEEEEEQASSAPEIQKGWGNGYFGWEKQLQEPPAHNVPIIPRPGKILLPPSSSVPRAQKEEEGNNVSNNNKLSFPDCLTVRVATSKEDIDVANLRLSVFSNFSPQVRQQLIHRSAKAVVKRRMQGATCIVATVPNNNSNNHKQQRHGNHNHNHRHVSAPAPSSVILGSAECSFHEFDNTILGQRRLPQSILYITEVAVSPNARRRGIGRKLLEAIDVLGKMRGIETLYLHVDVENTAAAAMYEKKGFRKVDTSDPMYLEFTTKLNLHDGATKGRKHFLMYKDIVTRPVWLPAPPMEVEEEKRQQQQPQRQVVSTEFTQPTGTLGFEVPC